MAAGLIPVIGHLPESGGALDQGTWLAAAFDILDGAAIEVMRDEE